MSEADQEKPRTIRDVYFRELNPTLHERTEGHRKTVEFTLSGEVIQAWEWTTQELTGADDPFARVKQATDLIARVVAHIGDIPVKRDGEQIEDEPGRL